MSQIEDPGPWVALLGEGLAADEATRSFVNRFARALFALEGFTSNRLRELPVKLLDPETIPAYALGALAASVGWSRSDPFVAELDEAALRRLVAVAFRLRRERGSEASWVDLLGVLVGRFVLVRSWFDRRAHTGTWGGTYLVPGLGTATPGGGPYSYPENVSDVWIEDPEEVVDLELAAGLLDRFRPSNERINVYRAWWVDTGRRGSGRWGIHGPGTAHTWDEEAAILTSTGDKFVARAGGGLESSWSDYAADFRLRLADGAEGQIGVGISADSEDGYVAVLDHGAQEVRLHLLVGNALGVAVATVPWRFGADAWIRWRIEHARQVGAVRIRVSFEGVTVIEYVDATNAYPTGAAGWGAGSSTAVDEQGVLVFPVLPDRARSGPNP